MAGLFFRLCFLSGRSFRRCLRMLRRLLLVLVIFFSPIIVFLTLMINREIIHYLARAYWLTVVFPGVAAIIRRDASSNWFTTGFNQAVLGGLLTLYGVIVTVWYYHATRQQEVAEKRLFIIEELLEELKRNRRVVDEISRDPSCSLPGGKITFSVGAWERLGADVALLPRRLHMRLSVLYACLGECTSWSDFQNRRATLERIPEVMAELNRLRSRLSKQELDF
ncbi:hypothetical protein [Desulfofundulus thermosubterraneus]|uniref:hypothetical protein n=1 Tax=Desulfofundulus thermosubterraneus TaxID=348840 RepID=UPI001041D7A9|nr:hypothetical protein [Desulfofundulus thermosubterraneus]